MGHRRGWDKEQIVTFEPGAIGAHVSEDGTVGDIRPSGQADQLGLKKGCIIAKLDDVYYTKQRLEELVAANKGFSATIYNLEIRVPDFDVRKDEFYTRLWTTPTETWRSNHPAVVSPM